MFPSEIEALARAVLDAARARKVLVATAESCTGGLVAAALTEIAGSSDVFDRGYVTYSNDAKRALLRVRQSVLARHGAVSEPVARAMAEGAVKVSGAGLAVAVTGIAGPGGGSEAKPVGLVHFAVAGAGGPVVAREMRFGDIGRSAIRLASVKVALEMLEAALA